jgi:hypothetical protein
LSHV